MVLPRLEDLDVKGKKVLLRLDLDVPLGSTQGKPVVADDTRLKAGIPTIIHLVNSSIDQIIILGHRGRPEGKVEKDLTLAPVGEHLLKLLQEEMPDQNVEQIGIFIQENLRFNPGEEANDEAYAKQLAELGDVFVNDAFAVCHREAASIVGLPKLMPHAAGLNLEREIKTLSGILEHPNHPVVVVLGGGKFDKVLFVDKLLNISEWVLVGGVLPKKVKSYCREDAKICVAAAHLTPDGRDITPDSAHNFVEIIRGAKTIIWNGPVGDVDSDFWEGTKIIAEAIATSSAFKVVGGGDTIGVINHLGIANKFDYISTGGGAFLEFLAYGDLPGLKALRDN